MHPSIMKWARHRRRHRDLHEHVCDAHGHFAGPFEPPEPPGPPPPPGPPGPFGHHHRGKGFGRRRPLRFLSHRLGLDDKQTAKLAKLLERLKIERAQKDVDDRRVMAALADAVEAEAFDREAAEEAAALTVAATKRVREVGIEVLADLHAMLDPEQREALAYLIRSGELHF
jgi:Spy/CpxP family protein refolding chaperone